MPKWVTGAMMLVKGECYVVAPFDLLYFLYWEDADLCFRARKAGWRVVVASEAEAWHRGGATVPTLGSYYYGMRNRLWFARRWRSRPRFLALSAVSVALILRTAVIDVLKRGSLRRTHMLMRGVLAGFDAHRPGSSFLRMTAGDSVDAVAVKLMGSRFFALYVCAVSTFAAYIALETSLPWMGGAARSSRCWLAAGISRLSSP